MGSMRQAMLFFKALTLGLAFVLVLALIKYLNSGALSERANPIGQILGIQPVDSGGQTPRVRIVIGAPEANASQATAKTQTK